MVDVGKPFKSLISNDYFAGMSCAFTVKLCYDGCQSRANIASGNDLVPSGEKN